MEMTYFVTDYLFNGDNKGWSYKIELKTNDLETAKRKYHELLAMYIGKAPFTHVCVVLEDMYGNQLYRENWDKAVEPEPQPEPEEITE